MKRPFTALLFCIVASSAADAQSQKVGHFSAEDLSGWKEEVFKGKTAYTLVKDDGRTVLLAHSRKAASGMLRKVSVKTRDYPILRWSWKVDHSLKREDVKKKTGDDFAARVYVVFPRTFFWQTRAINYVWAAKMAKDTAAPSPYTSNAIIIAAESGDEKAGKWVEEECNVYEDYRKHFGEEPPPIGAVAVMSDTDNTGDEVSAWYGDITLHGISP